MPVLERDDLLAAREATAYIPDRRARHYWDPRRSLGNVLARTLNLQGGGPAWDVYLVYGRQATWKGSPPMPADWMHQLGDEDPARILEGEELAMRVRLELRRER